MCRNSTLLAVCAPCCNTACALCSRCAKNSLNPNIWPRLRKILQKTDSCKCLQLFKWNIEPIRGVHVLAFFIMLLTRVAKWRNMHGAHCSPRICAKGYSHEWWSIGEFHNAVKSRSSLALRTEQLIYTGAQFVLWSELQVSIRNHHEANFFFFKCANIYICFTFFFIISAGYKNKKIWKLYF